MVVTKLFDLFINLWHNKVVKELGENKWKKNLTKKQLDW